MAHVKEYDKLVRDKIPDILEEAHKSYKTRIANPEEYESYLVKKLVEESAEFLESPCLEEAADIYEVFLAILNNRKLSMEQVQLVASNKKEIKGAFDNCIILEKVYENGES